MTVKFLIDECLSPELVKLANTHGYEAVAVRDRGWNGLKDPEIIAKAFDNDMVCVCTDHLVKRRRRVCVP